ncbi:Arc family DNA-binding protein [Tatumella terrea]|uniref:FitA-like ribbon-helix-helix domain-containing protein n=1 Tax=Tatumella terrea TaxID=419007 RepID=UPI0031DD6D5E
MKGARDISPLGVRLPDSLKARLQQESKKNGRSLNSEIVMILQSYIEQIDNPESINGLADKEAERFKEALLETLKSMYGKEK